MIASDWINLLLLLILVAGHTELLVTLVNRVHSQRIRCSALRQFRHIHDVLIPAFPLALFWFVGIAGPGLLVGGSWSDVPWPWTVYLVVCAAGAMGLAVSTARWVWRGIPRAQLSNHSVTVDVEERLGFRPVGDGPFRFLTRIPGNEVFRIEVSEKTCRLPRLPREWDGLSILHLTDLHFIGTLDRSFFEQVAELADEAQADLIVFTGDLLDNQRLVEWLPTTLGRLRAPLGCYFILGNHDWFLDPPAIRDCMAELGWKDVSGTTVTISDSGVRNSECGVLTSIPHSEFRIPNSIDQSSGNRGQSTPRTPLVVGGTELPWMGTHPDFSAAPANAFRLLLSHSPDNLPWARKEQIDLMLAGHNHGGQVVLPLLGPVYSPSRYGVRYSAGAFWEDPTLMYVSRGISGRHPLRWRCPPELTKLVLRSDCADASV